jgi:hypothetical protein
MYKAIHLFCSVLYDDVILQFHVKCHGVEMKNDKRFVRFNMCD